MRMTIGEEDFWFLLHNLAHWEFELFLMFIFDVVLGLLLIPFGKRWLKKHDEKKHRHEHCEDVHQGELFNEKTYRGEKPPLWIWKQDYHM
jgi:hypothetical protein